MSALEYVDSTPLLGNPEALRARGAEDGYLFFKRFLPPQDLLDLRAEMLAIIERHGWRQPGQDALGGRIDLEALNRVPDEEMRWDIGVSHAAYLDALKLERLNALPLDPKLVALYRELFGRDVFPHPHRIARMVTKHRVVLTTPPHQDFYFFQGTPKTWTCWIPVGDCPREMGSLSVLKGSHHNGFLPVQFAEGRGLANIEPCPGDTEWVEGDFEVGDILTFTSYTMHKALPCQHEELIRLSLDTRYQPLDEPVSEIALRPNVFPEAWPHSFPIDPVKFRERPWEEIYRGWSDPSLQYYWQKYSLQVSPIDDRLRQPGKRIC